MPKYNTGPCAPRIIRAAAEGLGLEPEKVAALEAAMVPADEAFVSMFAVVELSHLIQDVKIELPLVPLIYPGVFDTDTDKMFEAAVDDWDFNNTPCMLVAGHHAAAGTRPKLEQGRLQQLLDGWVGRDSVPVYSQVEGEMTPDQATWVADMIEQHGLTAIALRAHPFHGARGFLTQLTTLKKRGLDREVVLLPWWRPFNPFGKRPLTGPWPEEVWSDAALITGEAKRIHDYAKKGDVASLAELREYYDWLFNESPAALALDRYTS